MADSQRHRGPDSEGYFVDGPLGLSFRRLSIVDVAGGDQPLFNEDGSVVLVCNGEIYNHRELRKDLISRGHTFRTASDVEVLVHLYEEYGIDLLNRLNGQFAFALYDRKRRLLFLARDHFGICPLHYAVFDGVFVFASEIKAILEHPLAVREVNLTGLDEVLSFPGLISPTTMFKGVNSVKGGHYVTVNGPDVRVAEYWDLIYPREGEISYDHPESYYVERLGELFTRSVDYRLQGEVPIGFYLSGGLDSSLIAATIYGLSPGTERHSFSITFEDKGISEKSYQEMMARQVGSKHHEIHFNWSEIATGLRAMIRHCECPVKETYNTCSMALSKSARDTGVPVILTGEGADELFAGYVGYRFDNFGRKGLQDYNLENVFEGEIRERIWGDKDLLYEQDQYGFREIKAALYSQSVNEQFDDFDCLNLELVNKERLRGRHALHKRSYLDFKLRLADHLISDHGDRMALANSVEARYPFLDIELVEFAARIPPDLKLRGYEEKYILKRVASGLVPADIVGREKFGFHAPGSPALLKRRVEWIDDTLSYDRIKRQGYFNPDVIERLKAQYLSGTFRLQAPFETDLLAVVLTFGIFLEVFDLPDLA